MDQIREARLLNRPSTSNTNGQSTNVEVDQEGVNFSVQGQGKDLNQPLIKEETIPEEVAQNLEGKDPEEELRNTQGIKEQEDEFIRDDSEEDTTVLRFFTAQIDTLDTGLDINDKKELELLKIQQFEPDYREFTILGTTSFLFFMLSLTHGSYEHPPLFNLSPCSTVALLLNFVYLVGGISNIVVLYFLKVDTTPPTDKTNGKVMVMSQRNMSILIIGSFLSGLFSQFFSIDFTLLLSILLIGQGFNPFATSPTVLLLSIICSGISMMIGILQGHMNFFSSIIFGFVVIVFTTLVRITIYGRAFKEKKTGLPLLALSVFIIYSLTPIFMMRTNMIVKDKAAGVNIWNPNNICSSN